MTLGVGSAEPLDGFVCATQESGLPAEIVELIAAHNRERAAAKLGPLVANASLVAAAHIHAKDMAEHDMLSHEGSDGSKFHERIQRQGYQGRRMGENIAAAQDTVAGVMRDWMNSPHHRDNILGDFSEIGAARARAGDGTSYWCVTFGLPRPRLDPEVAAAGVVEAVNQARSKTEKPPLKVSPLLAKVAQSVAQELAALGDLGKAESTYAARVREAGYRYQLLGEAAASGQLTPGQVVEDWLDSPVHRENFLGKFREIGVGYATSGKGVSFWVVFLAQPAKR
jgi:uncharacterized protein YkwD